MEENVLIYLLSLGVSQAYVDPACEEIASAGPPEDYSEITQNNFLLNYYFLVDSLRYYLQFYYQELDWITG